MKSAPAHRLAPLLFLLLTASLTAQDKGVIGYWREPGGSVIHVDHCGPGICATLVSVSKEAPSREDIHNPDETLRTRPLYGLVLGKDFHLQTPSKAQDGLLYDPKSGKTYRGRIESRADQLTLRGYIGIPLFGRSETWTRSSSTPTCAQ